MRTARKAPKRHGTQYVNLKKYNCVCSITLLFKYEFIFFNYNVKGTSTLQSLRGNKRLCGEVTEQNATEETVDTMAPADLSGSHIVQTAECQGITVEMLGIFSLRK